MTPPRWSAGSVPVRRTASAPAAAQLAPAREYGFAGWPRFGAEVRRRRAAAPAAPPSLPETAATPPVPPLPSTRYRIVPAASLEELVAACDVIGAQVSPPFTHCDRRYQDLARHFPEDRALMLVVRDETPSLPPAAAGTPIVGGALAFRTGPRGVTLRMIGLMPHVRGRGIGRRLMAAVEVAAGRLGAVAISLGAERGVAGFYRRLGYAGRGPLMQKGLPLPGRSLEARLRRLAARTDDAGPTP